MYVPTKEEEERNTHFQKVNMTLYHCSCFFSSDNAQPFSHRYMHKSKSIHRMLWHRESPLGSNRIRWCDLSHCLFYRIKEITITNLEIFEIEFFFCCSNVTYVEERNLEFNRSDLCTQRILDIFFSLLRSDHK